MLRKIKDYLTPKGNRTYSQCGEDRIVEFALSLLGIQSPSYLEIGANHPFSINNTYLFYKKGASGVCVEPNPIMVQYFARIRPRDVCLNIGVSPSNAETVLPFYIMSDSTLSSFSKSFAQQVQESGGVTIEKVVDVACKPVNKILEEYFHDCPNLVSLDTEGLDVQILKSWDFRAWRPEVFCVETLDHHTDVKLHEIFKLMEENSYKVYGDTHINTIFVDSLKYKEWMR